MDILPTWVWVVLAGVVLVILAYGLTLLKGYGRLIRIAEVLSDKPKHALDKRPAKRFSKQRQDSWDKRKGKILEENYDAVIRKLSNRSWVLLNISENFDGTKRASFRRQDGLTLLVEKGMVGGVISFSGTGKDEAEKDLDT